MEQESPASAAPDTALEAEEPKKKSRWSFFELLKKEGNEGSPDADQPERPAKKTAETTPEDKLKRSFARSLLRLLRGDMPDRRLSDQPEKPPTTTLSEEAAPEQAPVTIAERAKHVGRQVLRLIGQVRDDVHQADEREHVAVPTNIQSLEQAGHEVRAAMKLIAPIVAYERTRYEQSEGVPSNQPEAAAEPSSPGPDYDAGGSQLPASARVVETAASAVAAAIELVEAREKPEAPRHRQTHKLGAFALAGGLVYSLHRQHELKKELRAQRKESRRFETEVRAYQEQAEHRYHAEQAQQPLQASAETSLQPQRQEYVHEVSQFAMAQAEQIRTVARAEQPQPTQQAPERMPLESEVPVFTLPRETLPQRERRQPIVPVQVERTPNARPEVASSPERQQSPTPRAERPLPTIERLNQALGGKPRQAAEVSTSGGAGLGARLFAMVAGTPAQPEQTPPQPTSDSSAPLQPTQQSSQPWLLGIALAIGVALLLLLALGVL